MTEKIKMGTILYQQDAPLPESLNFKSEAYSNGWRLVENLDACGLGRKIREAGWTFFFMAGEIKATAFGFDRQKTLRAALKRLIGKVQSQNCNSIEITQVTGESFLKLPYVSVSAHPRHLQKGLVFDQAFYNAI